MKLILARDVVEGRTYKFPAGSVRRAAATVEVLEVHDRMPNVIVFAGRRTGSEPDWYVVDGDESCEEVAS